MKLEDWFLGFSTGLMCGWVIGIIIIILERA